MISSFNKAISLDQFFIKQYAALYGLKKYLDPLECYKKRENSIHVIQVLLIIKALSFFVKKKISRRNRILFKGDRILNPIDSVSYNNNKGLTLVRY